uniref:Uncharacterized protein n=1 Tax=Oryzias latipes TaxID=8090 RepID=A0A3B3I4V8_ORYLA
FAKAIHTKSPCARKRGDEMKPENFPVNRGVRQRCPMRPLLFIISVELLAILLKYSPDFEGINILDREFKIIMIEKV